MKENISKKRKEAIRNAVWNVMREYKELSTGECVERAWQGGAPRFFVTYNEARRCCSALRKGIVERKNRYKGELYEEVYRRLKKANENCKKWSYLPLAEIIEQPAPSFYISKAGFTKLFYQR